MQGPFLNQLSVIFKPIENSDIPYKTGYWTLTLMLLFD